MPRTKGPPRPKQLHVLISPEEHRQMRVVAAETETKVSHLLRDIFIPEIGRRYAAIVGNGREKARCT